VCQVYQEAHSGKLAGRLSSGGLGKARRRNPIRAMTFGQRISRVNWAFRSLGVGHGKGCAGVWDFGVTGQSALHVDGLRIQEAERGDAVVSVVKTNVTVN